MINLKELIDEHFPLGHTEEVAKAIYEAAQADIFHAVSGLKYVVDLIKNDAKMSYSGVVTEIQKIDANIQKEIQNMIIKISSEGVKLKKLDED